MGKILKRGIILVIITTMLTIVVGCNQDNEELETSNVNANDLEKRLDSYDNEEDISYDTNLILEAMDIEEEMSSNVEEIMVTYNESQDKIELMENTQYYETVFKSNIDRIKEYKEEAKLQKTVELLEIIEELYKINYYQIVDIGNLKMEEANKWNEVYNSKLDNYNKEKSELVDLYSDMIE